MGGALAMQIYGTGVNSQNLLYKAGHRGRQLKSLCSYSQREGRGSRIIGSSQVSHPGMWAGEKNRPVSNKVEGEDIP